MTESRQFHLAARPEGEIKDSDFTLVTAAVPEPADGVLDGQLRSVEDTVPGDIETFPGMLRRLFAGQNTGKLALELSPMKGQT
jgi:NADPH-dependent curcumin reductase CurA